jgi:hypothetical protein
VCNGQTGWALDTAVEPVSRKSQVGICLFRSRIHDALS